MQLFIDSADDVAIASLAAQGLIDGVTTNPTLMAQQGHDPHQHLEKICHLVHGPVSAECIATQYDAMLQEAQQLAKIHRNIVVKIPLTVDGLRCVQQLDAMNIKTNVTLCFSLSQGLLAAKAGATYISPFVGRLDDSGVSGINLVKQLADLYRLHQYPTKVLAASIRHIEHFNDVVLAGADAVTVPVKLFPSLWQHPLTDKGLQQFLTDYHQVYGSKKL